MADTPEMIIGHDEMTAARRSFRCLRPFEVEGLGLPSRIDSKCPFELVQVSQHSSNIEVRRGQRSVRLRATNPSHRLSQLAEEHAVATEELERRGP